jgi:serine/threonine-protein kinase RsbW
LQYKLLLATQIDNKQKMSHKILIIDDYDDLASKLEEVFTQTGYKVKKTESLEKALLYQQKENFDIVIFDLDVQENLKKNLNKVESAKSSKRSNTRLFKILAENYNLDKFSEADLKNVFETTLNCKAQFVDRKQNLNRELQQERIEFVFPSALSLIYSILNYLVERVEKMGIIKSERSNLYVALDEAFVNAIKHGNKFDKNKLIRIIADLSSEEARFIIEDQGEGFDINSIPDPTLEENLMKSSGRGVLIIKKIMDEVHYNEKGNRLEMVKRFEK